MAFPQLSTNGNGSNGASWYKPKQILDHNGNPIQSKRYDDYPVPNVVTFGAMVSSAYRKHLHGGHDIALQHDRESALSMFRDSDITALLWERMRAVAAAQGAAFLNAGSIIRSSSVDGIHFDKPAHAALGRSVAGKLREMFG